MDSIVLKLAQLTDIQKRHQSTYFAIVGVLLVVIIVILMLTYQIDNQPEHYQQIQDDDDIQADYPDKVDNSFKIQQVGETRDIIAKVRQPYLSRMAQQIDQVNPQLDISLPPSQMNIKEWPQVSDQTFQNILKLHSIILANYNEYYYMEQKKIMCNFRLKIIQQSQNDPSEYEQAVFVSASRQEKERIQFIKYACKLLGIDYKSYCRTVSQTQILDDQGRYDQLLATDKQVISASNLAMAAKCTQTSTFTMDQVIQIFKYHSVQEYKSFYDLSQLSEVIDTKRTQEIRRIQMHRLSDNLMLRYKIDQSQLQFLCQYFNIQEDHSEIQQAIIEQKNRIEELTDVSLSDKLVKQFEDSIDKFDTTGMKVLEKVQSTGEKIFQVQCFLKVLKVMMKTIKKTMQAKQNQATFVEFVIKNRDLLKEKDLCNYKLVALGYMQIIQSLVDQLAPILVEKLLAGTYSSSIFYNSQSHHCLDRQTQKSIVKVYQMVFYIDKDLQESDQIISDDQFTRAQVLKLEQQLKDEQRKCEKDLKEIETSFSETPDISRLHLQIVERIRANDMFYLNTGVHYVHLMANLTNIIKQ